MTTVKMSFTISPDLAEAARRKSAETGVPLSVAIQRLLARWIETGELPPATTPANEPKGGKKPKRTKTQP